MAKLLIVSEEFDLEKHGCLKPEAIITWLDVTNMPANLSKTWEKADALCLKSDDNNEILKQGDEYCIISINSVIRIENVSNKSCIYIEGGEFFTTSTPIETLEETFIDCNLFRVHPNHLINIAHMKSFIKCNAFITMSNSDSIPVSIGNDDKIVDYLNDQSII